MKVKLNELAAALKFIEANSFETEVTVEELRNQDRVDIKCFDKENKVFTIHLHEARNTTFASVTKEDRLPLK